MKLLILGCRTMREGVVASLAFFIILILMLLAAVYLIPDQFNMQHIAMALGFIMLLAPLILLSVLPQRREDPDSCEH
ncbi:MAG: hypothetical protein RNU03_03945 [Candidatus Sedimenticola sp. (ex Thyasira tokunagai)]